MYKIVSSRGGGRTTTLCEYAINNEKNIITPMFSSAKYIFSVIHNRLKEKGFKILEEEKAHYGFNIIWSNKDIFGGEDGDIKGIDIVVASSDVITSCNGGCVVDDADEVLKYLVRKNLGYNVTGLTMSME